MPENRLPTVLWIAIILYLLWWIVLFAVVAWRLDIISPLIDYRKMVYGVAVILWNIFVFILVLNKQAHLYVENLLRRIAGRNLPLQPAGVLFGLVGVDLGLYNILTA